jgi:hypothetical protein
LTNHLDQGGWIALSESKAGEANHVTPLRVAGIVGVNAEALSAQFNRHKGRRTGGCLMSAISIAGTKAHDDPGIALPVSPCDERMRDWK